MTCNHCSGVITKALNGLDPNIKVEFDMQKHIADVTTNKTLDVVLETLAAAGYPSTVVV
jgi:copper chaperone CopZ